MKAYCDGSCKVSNPGQTSCAYAIYDGDTVFQASSRYLGPELHTNNWAEFQGLLDLLLYAAQNSITRLDINCDSQLVVKLVEGEWKVKHEELRPLRDLAQALMIRGHHTLHWVRGHAGNTGNELVDFLCNKELERVMESNEKNLLLDYDTAKKNLLLIYDTAKAYAERTGMDFYECLTPTEQRQELEKYKEDHGNL